MTRPTDISADLGPDGQAVLSDAGRRRFAAQRATLLVVCAASLGLLVGAMASAIHARSNALTWAYDQAELRLQADHEARQLLAQDRKRILVDFATKALPRVAPEKRSVVETNLQALWDVEHRLVQAPKPTLERQEEALTVWTSPSGATYALNATEDGRLDPRAVEAFHREDLSGLVALALRRAEEALAANPEAILRRDLAEIHAQVRRDLATKN